MYKIYKKDSQVNMSKDNKQNDFCYDFSLFKIINAGRSGANNITFEYYGEEISNWRVNMITKRYNETFSDRDYTLFFERGNQFNFNYYAHSGVTIGEPINVIFDYENSKVTIAGIDYKIVNDDKFVCKKSRGKLLKCYGSVTGLAKTLASQNNPDSPLNSWGYNILKILAGNVKIKKAV